MTFLSRPKAATALEAMQRLILDKQQRDGQPPHTRERDFRRWLAKSRLVDGIRTRQIAKTMLSTWIEETTGAQGGVFFVDYKTVSVTMREQGGVEERIPVPNWMTKFILTYAEAPWAKTVREAAQAVRA